jgi:hypothetical protein
MFLVMFFLTDETIKGLATVASLEDHVELHACQIRSLPNDGVACMLMTSF